MSLVAHIASTARSVLERLVGGLRTPLPPAPSTESRETLLPTLAEETSSVGRSTEAPVEFGGLADFRRSVLLRHVSLPCDTLEIGAFATPTLLPQETRLEILDFYSTDELREQAARIGVDVERVLPVDCVCRDDRYDAVIREPRDLVIANHVVEHVDNPIAWLHMMRRMLRDSGLLFLVLPDKKFSFDRFRPDTPLSHILYDYFRPDHNLKELHSLETALYYDLTYIGQENALDTKLDLERLRDSLSQLHPGIHTHVFQFETFPDLILRPLVYMNAIDFEIVEIVDCAQFGEFAVVLRAPGRPSAFVASAFFKPATDTQRPT